METIAFDIAPTLKNEAEVKQFWVKETENPTNNSSINEREQQKEKALAALVKVQTALKGAAEKAGFKNEEELQRYAKDVVRQEIWEERYAKSYA